MVHDRRSLRKARFFYQVLKLWLMVLLILFLYLQEENLDESAGPLAPLQTSSRVVSGKEYCKYTRKNDNV